MPAKRKTRKSPAKGRTTAKRKPAKRTSARKSSKKSGEVLLVGSKVKAGIKQKGCNTGGDALDGINTWVHWLIEQGSKRAKANGRKTVRAHDFIVM